MNILALDLGTKTGWATLTSDCSATTDAGIELYRPVIRAGTWVLGTEKELKKLRLVDGLRSYDPRVVNLWNHIDAAHRQVTFDLMVFEDVQFVRSQCQAQLWASFRAVVWIFAAVNKIHVDCLSVQKLKIFGAGKGNADKDQMRAAAIARYPELSAAPYEGVATLDGKPLDDNAIDAFHLLIWAKKINSLKV